MKLTADEILDRVDQSQRELGQYYQDAQSWDRMYRLDAGFTKTWRESVESEGREQVITPDPYNIVNLASRLISDKPYIKVPPRDSTEASAENAQNIEKWLTGFWQYINTQTQRNVIEDAKWYLLVRGSCIFEVLWAEDLYPKAMRKKAFPLLVRLLDPLNAGVKRGPLYTEWAYHRYIKDMAWAKQKYPKLKNWINLRQQGRTSYDEDYQVTITDFWYIGEGGEVWNAVLVDDQFGKMPRKMPAYPQIPIFEGFGDSAPSLDESTKRLSILAPIDGLWQYKCRLHSLIATASLWETWPMTTVSSESGEIPEEFEVRPGKNYQVPWGFKLEHHVPPANLNVLQTILTAVDAAIQQASFPSVMYGDPQGIQSGYGVNILQQASINRVDPARNYLEMLIQQVNEFSLCMVDENAGPKGVSLYARKDASRDAYSSVVTPKMLDGYYCNVVTLTNTVAQDEIAKMTALSNLAGAGILSKAAVRDNVRLVELPPDEESRIWTERAFETPEMQPRVMLAEVIKKYPQDWFNMIRQTPLEQAAQAMGILPPPPAPPQPPQPPPGPPMGPGGPQGPPQGPPGPQVNQPPSQFADQMTGQPIVPPEMAGQLTPNNMGVPGMDPMTFQAMMGRPMTPQEEMEYLSSQQGMM
jgi:hypothetical protein